MKPGRNLFLVGPMGVGKTSIGRHLAAALAMDFVDLDEEIERRCGADIPWIFDVEGEAGFRARESRLLAEIARHRDTLLSTGGGVVLDENNRKLLQASGLVIFLTASTEELYRRTLKDKRRPLLQVEDRRGVIDRLKREREPLYREVADIVFDVGHRNAQRAAEDLLTQVRAHGG